MAAIKHKIVRIFVLFNKVVVLIVIKCCINAIIMMTLRRHQFKPDNISIDSNLWDLGELFIVWNIVYASVD